jgi:tetratricopeptide (TPR) repeat protein
MLTSSLTKADDETWHDEPGYSHVLHRLLVRAYALVQAGRGQVGAYLRASLLLEPWRQASMSLRQRMRLYFLFALAQAAAGQYQVALFWIDEALPIAFELAADGDQAELLFHRAALNRAVLLLREAADDLRDYLAILDLAHEHRGADEPAARLRALPHLATYEYFSVDFDVAEQHIAAARALIAQVPGSTFEAAATAWVQADLDLLRGQPERALRPALAIVEVYNREATPISQERAEIFVSQTALQLAVTLPAGSDRNALLEFARPHLERAEQLARDAEDKPGQGLTHLVRAQYARLSRSTTDRIASIEAVIRFARDIDDVAVLAQARTALGDEYAARGEIESALTCYRATVEVAAASEVPVLAVPAQRALRRAREMRTNDDQ